MTRRGPSRVSSHAHGRSHGRARRDWGLAAALLAPSLSILGVFVLYPLGRAILLGRQRCDPSGDNCRTNGWHQYVDVFRSREFQQAFGVTFRFALMTVPIGLVLGVALAVLVDKQLRGMGAFRTIFSSTVATSVAVASLMWFFLLEPSVGVLADWIGGTAKNPGLLHSEGTALWAVAVSSIWANLGFTFIVVTAGLQGIPADLYESAYVDGASGWMRFSNVTFPMLGPTLLFASVVLTGRAFQSYGEFDLLTGGGPNGSTTSLTYLIYGNNSLIKNDQGLQSASAVLLFIVLLALALLQIRGVEKRVHYGN
ncbi:MAG: sugar ABC transporter permease [Actinomycetota bacterium]|jgi:ABC-type sugar transport system permease subunit|nr:MAG: putative ABC transporter permease protein [Acidimicrobiaceae bacterium]